MPQARRIFISYSHADTSFRQELEKHLAPLLLVERVESWSDRKLHGGQALSQKIAENIDNADIVLLLISADYFASKSCLEEMQSALNRSQDGSAVVIPVIIRTCDWQILPLGAVLAVPKDGKAVAMWPSPDEAWTNVVVTIRSLVQDWEAATARAADDQQPAESIKVAPSLEADSVAPRVEHELPEQAEKPMLKPDKWVYRQEGNDLEWEDVKDKILDELLSLVANASSTGITLNGRRWGTKILVDVTYPGMHAYRRIWLEDIGGNPGCPGYQLRIAADDRLNLKSERFRWLSMTDGSKFLMPLNRRMQEAFTPEAYAGHLWTLIRLGTTGS